MTSIPFLLQHIDQLRDRYVAAMESISLLTSTLELQETHCQDMETCLDTTDLLDQKNLETSQLVALARSGFVAGTPFSTDLLSGYIGLDPIVEELHKTKRKVLSPFTVVEETSEHTTSRYLLKAAPGDTNGSTYLDRCKINVFLTFIQSRAGASTFQRACIEKIAELLFLQRKIVCDSANERSRSKAAQAVLHHERNHMQQQCQSLQQPSPVKMTLIAKYIAACTTCIDLSSSALTNAELTAIQPQLRGFARIQLDHNALTDPTILAVLIEQSAVLTTLHLQGNPLEASSPFVLARALQRNERIDRVQALHSGHVLYGFQQERKIVDIYLQPSTASERQIQATLQNVEHYGAPRKLGRPQSSNNLVKMVQDIRQRRHSSAGLNRSFSGSK